MASALWKRGFISILPFQVISIMQKSPVNTADAYMKSKFFLKERRANLVNYLSMARKAMGTLFQLKEIRYISSVLSLDRAMFFKKFIE